MSPRYIELHAQRDAELYEPIPASSLPERRDAPRLDGLWRHVGEPLDVIVALVLRDGLICRLAPRPLRPRFGSEARRVLLDLPLDLRDRRRVHALLLLGLGELLRVVVVAVAPRPLVASATASPVAPFAIS